VIVGVFPAVDASGAFSSDQVGHTGGVFMTFLGAEQPGAPLHPWMGLFQWVMVAEWFT
jgi:hypothetical protein